MHHERTTPLPGRRLHLVERHAGPYASPRRLTRRDLVTIDGGAQPSDTEGQWSTAWSVIHTGVEGALTSLPPDHPRRAELLTLLRDAAEIAGLESPSVLRTVASHTVSR